MPSGSNIRDGVESCWILYTDMENMEWRKEADYSLKISFPYSVFYGTDIFKTWHFVDKSQVCMNSGYSKAILEYIHWQISQNMKWTTGTVLHSFLWFSKSYVCCKFVLMSSFSLKLNASTFLVPQGELFTSKFQPFDRWGGMGPCSKSYIGLKGPLRWPLA